MFSKEGEWVSFNHSKEIVSNPNLPIGTSENLMCTEILGELM